MLVDSKLAMVKLPVATAHVGWVIVPATGALGVAGCASTVSYTHLTLPTILLV